MRHVFVLNLVSGVYFSFLRNSRICDSTEKYYIILYYKKNSIIIYDSVWSQCCTLLS